jgi:UDP-glucose 4-epimerase
MKLEGSKILVTGGAGLIGSTTIDQLLANEKPAEIVIFDNMTRGTTRNLENALKDERVKLIKGDIRDRNAVMQVTEGMDAVVHMAAIRITACAADPREAMEVMNDGTFNVIDAAHQQGVKKVLAASSASILGLADSFPTTEDHHPYNNRTWYGASKIMLEGLLRSYNDMYGLNYVAMRYFNVYGPRMDVEGKYTEVLVRWVQRISQGVPPLILGDGKTSMDFIYIEDLARANVLALKSDVSDEVFHIASGVETSLSELAATTMKVMGAPADMVPEYGPERKVNAVSRRLSSTEKAERLLGFKAQVSLEEGVSRFVTWWEANKDRFTQ